MGHFNQKVEKGQKLLAESNLDGWLIYDFKHLNPLGLQFLEIPPDTHLTRRLFYWLPKKGEPVKLVSAIEDPLKKIPGKTMVFHSFKELKERLREIVKGKTIAMEYSPFGAVPEVSKVDAGTIELIRELGGNVVSSGDLFQGLNCVLSEEGYVSHLKAASLLDQIVADTWKEIGAHLGVITERKAVEYIKARFEKAGLVTEGEPVVAVNENSSFPHYTSQDRVIQEGDFILIDLWAKFKQPGSIFADITRVGVAAKQPTDEQIKIFNLTKAARDAATKFIQDSYGKKRIEGWEVDETARSVIEKGGFGKYFVHRLGHNIHERTHGPGAHNDNLETEERRALLPGTLCSIEPGIYLPNRFGVRLEYDLYLNPNGQVEVTGGIQTEIVCLK